jgi:hypothetical protein
MVACGISGLLGGRLVVLPVADNSLIAAVPVWGFLVVAFFATGFLLAALAVVFLIAIFFSPLFDFHFLGKCAFQEGGLFFRVPVIE